jgi:Uma2 family endonuclease
MIGRDSRRRLTIPGSGGTLDFGIQEAPMSEPATPLSACTNENGPWPVQGEWTYEDYRRLPDDGRRYEVIHGVLYVNPAPRLLHQYVSSELLWRFQSFVRKRRLGFVLGAPLDLRLPGGVANPVQPDLLFVRREKAPDWKGQSLIGVPDLVVEIVSPGSRRFDRIVKLAAYQEAGVPEYWLVDLDACSVAVYALNDDGQYAEHCRGGRGEMVASRTLQGLRIKVSHLFPADE